MKTRGALLLSVIGGVLAGAFNSAFSNVPPLVVSIVGGFLFGFSFMVYNSVFSGKVWGIKVKPTTYSMLVWVVATIGLIVGGFAVVFDVLASLSLLLRGEFVNLLLVWVALIGSLVVGGFTEKPFVEVFTAKQTNALCLGQLPIFQQIDAELGQASHFVVGFEGVALYSKADYCYAIYRYTDFELGELSTPAEVALVGTYFIQKYGEQFTFKVDVEIIPGTPGQTTVLVGMGGVSVQRTAGTLDQQLFKSYIFKRKGVK